MYHKKKEIHHTLITTILAIMFCSPSFAYTVSYTYNNLNRLTQATYDNGNSIDYTHDSVGNITNIEYAGEAQASDLDNDGASDSKDNCIYLSNPDQADSNSNGIGDACDFYSDSDKDGLSDAEEYYLGTNPLRKDSDGDGVSDNDEYLCNSDPLSSTSSCKQHQIVMPWLMLLLDDKK